MVNLLYCGLPGTFPGKGGLIAVMGISSGTWGYFIGILLTQEDNNSSLIEFF
jgi:hypothetical protein